MNNTIFSSTITGNSEVANLPKVGDIIVSTSGYEACIAHFAKVIGVTKASVKIVRLGNNDTYRGSGGMEWESLPNLNAESDKVETKRFKAYGDTYKVKDNSYATFYPWAGKPISCYNYH